MALAGDENDVARLGQGDCAGDRFCAVGNFFVISGLNPFFTSAMIAPGIFLPRIIGSDDAVVGVLVGHASHQRPFLLGRDRRPQPKTTNEAAGSEFVQRLEDVEKASSVCA